MICWLNITYKTDYYYIANDSYKVISRHVGGGENDKYDVIVTKMEKDKYGGTVYEYILKIHGSTTREKSVSVL